VRNTAKHQQTDREARKTEGEGEGKGKERKKKNLKRRLRRSKVAGSGTKAASSNRTLYEKEMVFCETRGRGGREGKLQLPGESEKDKAEGGTLVNRNLKRQEISRRREAQLERRG